MYCTYFVHTYMLTYLGTELKKKLESFSTQFQGQHLELEQLRSKIRQAESDRQLAVSKAKLLEEELNNQQKLKAHEDKLRHFEELKSEGATRERVGEETSGSSERAGTTSRTTEVIKTSTRGN